MPAAIRVTVATSTNSRPSTACGRGGCAASATTPAAARSIALSASHGRAEWPERPWKLQVALMLPRQPACSSQPVGSIITTSAASSGSRSSSGVSADSACGSSSRPKNRQRTGAPASASSSATATAPFMSLAPRPCTRSPSIRPGRLSCAGTVSRWPARTTPAPSSPASTQESPMSRTGTPPARRTASTWAASRASARDSDGMSISSSVRAASRSARSPTRGAYGPTLRGSGEVTSRPHHPVALRQRRLRRAGEAARVLRRCAARGRSCASSRNCCAPPAWPSSAS